MRKLLPPGPLLLALLAGGPLSRGAAQTAAADSPFAPAAGAAAVDAAPGETLELSGISVTGKKTYVSIFDTENKHSRWIAVGQNIGGVEVISCDVRTDRAVVRAGGKLRTLNLRHPAATADYSAVTDPVAPLGQPSLISGAPPLVAPASTAPLSEQAIQEREARMMVSDLLEIGQMQRKAYEEKKAALDAAAKKDAPP